MKRLAHRGLLVVFEGIDGAGKTTLQRGLAERLEQTGLSVVQTREPGGTPLGNQVRAILHESSHRPCPLAEFLLFAADRAQQVSDVVLPALHDGKIVLSDRFADSSAAYQGAGRGVDVNFIDLVNKKAVEGLVPDLTVYVRLDPAVAAKRMQDRAEKLTALEQEFGAFFKRIADWFDTRYAGRSDVLTVEAHAAPEVLVQEVFERVQELLNNAEVQE